MKSLKIAFLLFLIAFSTKAQNGQANNSESKSSYVNVSIFSMADLYAPRLRFGYIQHLAPHWKAGLDFGYGTKKYNIICNRKANLIIQSILTTSEVFRTELSGC